MGMQTFFHDKGDYVQFLLLWNDWFDCVNSRLGRHRWNELKSGFGGAGEATLIRQKAILERAYKYTLAMRAILRRDEEGNPVPKRVCLPFQLGIARSSKAILLMWEDLKIRYPSLEFLMTARLNQVRIQGCICCGEHKLIFPFLPPRIVWRIFSRN